MTTLINWVSQPHIRRRLLIGLGVGATILVLVPLGVATMGFGPAGIIGGSVAAGLQSALYGGFVPAGGAFATLTSVAMTGSVMEMVALPAAAIGGIGSAALL
ncbi:hypothetical protein FS749_007811 [Ceratobasidium sp. UAMH 11750]|nr:hypothetical protein FS749_007811 [Ceratobasidium sp. UAMH 11750]